MRFVTRRSVSLLAIGTLALAWSGCSAKKQTEYVAGVTTQVQVPRDLKTIRVDVSVGGALIFCQAYTVYNGVVQLPRSLGELKDPNSSGFDPITVTIAGYTDDYSDTSPNDQISNCSIGDATIARKGPTGGARVLRKSRQPYIADQIRFLPMPLHYSCWDKDCSDQADTTCKGGTCKPIDRDPNTLPLFSPELVDGTGIGCFHATECMAAAEPVAVVNPDDCTYALPNTPSAPPVLSGLMPNPVGPPPGQPWDGLNVEVTFDGGANSEILDKVDDEGFTIPDATKPQQFRLAAGLCELVHGVDSAGNATTHRITAVRASGTCRSKGEFDPICSDDALKAVGADPSGASKTASVKEVCTPTEIKPPKSVLMVVVDSTTASPTFYQKFADNLAAISLADPAFDQTDIGLVLFPGAPARAMCTAANSVAPDVAPKPARQVKTAVGTAFKNAATKLAPPTPTELDGALRDTYGLLAQSTYADYYRRAVIVIGNHGFKETTCTGQTPDKLTKPAHDSNGIDTYVVELETATPPPADPTDASGAAIALASMKATYDSRMPAIDTPDTSKGVQPIRDIINDLATCVYDPPSGTTPGTLAYTDPVTSLVSTVAHDDTCAGGVGWKVDPTKAGRVRLCDGSCTSFRNVLAGAAAYANQYGQPALAVPMFSFSAACAPTKTGP